MGKVRPALQGSPDDPLYPEDRGALQVRAGMQKRLLGNARAIEQARALEAKVYVYANRVKSAQAMRRYKVDIVEVYGGHAEITHQALRHGLRALQPVDRDYGINLDDRADFERLRPKLLAWRPFLLIYEIACALWSNVQRINYSCAQLDELRKTQDLAIKEMCRTITENWDINGGYFLIENPAHTKFWDHPAIQ